MLDLTWKLFSQTGNIEAYLLLKDLEATLNKEDDDVDAHEALTFKQ